MSVQIFHRSYCQTFFKTVIKHFEEKTNDECTSILTMKSSVKFVHLKLMVWFYFVGKDVAEVLGYTNSRKAIRDHVDDEDKTDEVTIRDAIGRKQKTHYY